MHACGHNAHVTMLLGAAKLLRGKKDELKESQSFLYHGMQFSTSVPSDTNLHDDFKPTNKLENSNLSLKDIVQQVLHAGKTNKNSYKTLIASEYSGIQVEPVQNFEMGVSNKTPEFLAMNPIGKVPVLETPDGPIFESNAIARFTCLKPHSSLYGSSQIEYHVQHLKKFLMFWSFMEKVMVHWSI